jgi:ABC-type nitrate/sulfonate/bicarbonate transport system ATPase subunit
MPTTEEAQQVDLNTSTQSKEELDSPSQFVPQSCHRASHVDTLLKTGRESLARFDGSLTDGGTANNVGSHSAEIMEEGGVVDAAPISEQNQKFQDLCNRLSVYQERVPDRLVEVRVKDFSYFVPVKPDAPTMKTVSNQSICYAAYEVCLRIHQYRIYRRSLNVSPPANGEENAHSSRRRSSVQWSPMKAVDIFLPFDKKPILSNINLVLKPGRTYVVLGPPESGKSSLLKAIAGRLPVTKGGKPRKDKPHHEGRVEYNGVSVSDDPGMVLPNIVSFVGQLDIHAPYLTVKETFDFAFQSRTGGKHRNLGIDSMHFAEELDQQNFTENLTIEGLDLSVCADTFVGNSDVRGVSGGQRRRVTVGGTRILVS